LFSCSLVLGSWVFCSFVLCSWFSSQPTLIKKPAHVLVCAVDMAGFERCLNAL
jgi:hypothetical protein